MARPSNKRNKRKPKGLVSVAVVLVGLSLFQYMNKGEVTWLAQVLESAREYADRHDVGWEKAAEGIEDLGAWREGQNATAFDLEGRVTGISDGDTLVILDGAGDEHTIRLFGIDTPEWDQAHGAEAKAALAKLLRRQSVGAVVVEKDGFGRTVATIYLGQSNINLLMVQQGHAWWYQRYAPYERHLAAAEKSARQQRLGLWAAADPTPPWIWRRQH